MDQLIVEAEDSTDSMGCLLQALLGLAILSMSTVEKGDFTTV